MLKGDVLLSRQKLYFKNVSDFMLNFKVIFKSIVEGDITFQGYVQAWKGKLM